MKLKPTILLTLLVLTLPAFLTADDNNRKAPNIILIMADDMAWADVGYNGQQDFETPHIDQMAADGMRFSDAYAGASVCSPSRACLLTGMYSPRHNIYHPGAKARGHLSSMKLAVPNREQKNDTYDWFIATEELDPKFQSFAEVVKSAGYATARIGKWHVGPDEQGFDLSASPGNDYRDRNGTKTLTDAGIKFIRDKKDKPFLLFLSYYDVHIPLLANKETQKKYEAKKEKTGRDFNPAYAAMTEAVDTGVGRVRAELKKLKLDENTLVIFTSDNGGFPGATNNRPLNGYKGNLYEGGIRVPTCMVWPGKIQKRTTCSTPITFVDYLPTFAELTGASLDAHEQPVDGVSLVPLMMGKSIPERAIYWHFPLYANLSNRVRKSKPSGTFPVFGTKRLYWRGVPATAIRRGNYKLLYFYEDKSIKLFDLANDIGESKDLSKTQPEIADRLLKELKAWTTATNAPTPTQLNPEFNPKGNTKSKKKKSKPAAGNQPKVSADMIHKQQFMLVNVSRFNPAFLGAIQ